MSKHVYAVVKFKIDPEYVDEYLAMADYFVQEVRKTEDGNVFYHLVKIKNEEYDYMIIGAWKDEESLQVHFNSDLFKNKVPKMGSMYTEFAAYETDMIF